MNRNELDQWLSDPARRPLVMAVLNVTPDSFSDGGKFFSPADAVASARQMIADGADWLDIGGESTRPGSTPVPASQQIDRVLPVIEALRDAKIVISIDTTDSAVACAALDGGATVVNDISAGRFDGAMLPLIARRNAAIILMHMLGTPATMQATPSYKNVVTEVINFLKERGEVAMRAGISRDRILIDPGIGFGKTVDHNLDLLRNIRTIREQARRAVVVGPSRKSFIGTITNQPDPSRRIFGTAACVALSIASGASVVRVHDVGPMYQIVKMVRAIQLGVDRV